MNDILENDEHDGRDDCCSGGGESGEKGEHGNWNGKQAGVEGEWGKKNGDERKNSAN